jgi:chromosome segregation ATPase
MRDINLMSSSNSSSSSQQQVNASNGNNKFSQSFLVKEISTLRSRLRELDNASPAMNRSGSQSALDISSHGGRRDALDVSTHGGQRQPPQNGDTALVNQLRKELAKVEHEKAEMELTLMNQMSNLAYENQTTIDSLRSRLSQSEKLIETLQSSSTKPAASPKPSTFEVHRLKKSLEEERGLRKVVEEERDALSQEVRQIKEQRDSCEQENAKMRRDIQSMQQQNGVLQWSGPDLSKQVRELEADKRSLQSDLSTATREHQTELAELERRHQSRISSLEKMHEAALFDMERSYQLRLTTVERDHRTQLNQMQSSQEQGSNPLEIDSDKKFDKNQSGTGNLHSRISELESDNEHLSCQIDDLRDQLVKEQARGEELAKALESETDSCNKLWESVQESQERCSLLEQELGNKFESSQSDLQSENEMLTNQIAAIHEQFVSEQEKCSKLQTALQSEKNMNTKLRASLREHQNRYQDLNRSLHRNQSGMGLVNGKIEALEKEKASLMTKLSKLHDELINEQERSNQLQASIDEHKSNIEGQMQGRRQSDAAALETAQYELQSVMNSYQSDVARLERKVQISQEQLAERSRHFQRLEAEINEERKIRKSLAAQLKQLKLANKQPDDETNSNADSCFSTKADHSKCEAEINRLRKENMMLNDELQAQSRDRPVNPAEIEFLRKQNRMLGERAHGLHADEKMELEKLREKTKVMQEELTEMRDMRAASPASTPTRGGNLSVHRRNDQEAELSRLRKQNKALNEELTKLKQQMTSGQDTASSYAGGEALHTEQQQELEYLRGKTQAMEKELKELRKRKEVRSSLPSTPPSRSSSPSTFRQRGQEAELARLKNQNKAMSEELDALKQQLASGRDSSSSNKPCGARNCPVSQPPSSPRRAIQGLAPVSPGRTKAGSPASGGMQTPPLSPPLVRKKTSVNKGSPRTPVRGLVESFERRISRSNSCSSLSSAVAAAASAEDQAQATIAASAFTLAVASAQTQAEGAQSSELDDIRRELDEERATVQELREKLKNESELVHMFRSELAKMEESDSKRAELEQVLEQRERETRRLRAKVSELEHIALEAADMRQAMEAEKVESSHLAQELQQREHETQQLQAKVSELEDIALEAADIRQAMEAETATNTDLRKKLQTETDQVATLRSEFTALRTELSKMEQSETRRVELEKQCHESEDEIQRLRSKVGELEVFLSSVQTLSNGEEEIAKLKGELAQADAARQAFENKLFEDREELERLQSEIAKAEQRLEESQMEVQRLSGELEGLKVLEGKKKQDEELIERLQAELGAAREGLERSLDEVEKMRSDSAADAASNQEGLLEKQKDKEEIERLRSELVVAKEALDINVEEMEKLQKCVKDADTSRMIAVRQSLSNHHEGQLEIEKLKAEIEKEKEANLSKTEEVNRLRSQVEALQQELEDALTYVEELKTIIGNIQTAHDSELQDAQKSEKRTNRSFGAEVDTLKVELTKNQMAKADMQMEYMAKIHDLEASLDALRAEMDMAVHGKASEMDELKQTLARKDDEIRQLQKEREQICSSMNHISSSRKDEMDQLQEELMALTAKTAAQTREIQSLKMQVEEHDFRKSEFERLKERIEELEEELRKAPTRTAGYVNRSDMTILKAENTMLRESIRDLSIERRNLQEKLDALLAEKASSKSTQVLRERNAVLKKEVERLTKRLKKMEHSMTRFTI